jgi:hypothetical protein
MNAFRFTESDILYLKTVLPATTEAGFFDWLLALDCTHVKV